MTVNFYDSIEDERLKFAVIVAKCSGKWVFCQHKERTTYEFAGGHREKGESILDTAKRELYEETGAEEFTIKPVCVYSVTGKNQVNETGEECFGMLYFADIKRFGKLPAYEMEKVILSEKLPENWTYPQIQPKLTERVNSAVFADEKG